MSSTVVYNGVSYSIPAVGDSAWGTSVTSYLTALATGSLTKAGGAFTLTADVNFGTTYGLISKYYKSSGSNLATSGVLRLANAETIVWRDSGNSANLALTVDSSGYLTFDSARIATSILATFSDNVFRISGSSDATKLAAFEVDGFTTATTRTFTLPNYDATLATIAGSEILTNKTLTSPTLTTPILGTPSSGTLTSCTGLPIVAGTTGTLSVARGGTGVTTSTGSGDVVLSTSPTLITPALGTPASGNLASCTALPIVNGTTGTLSIARGGTGQTTAQTAIDALLPSQTSNSGKVLGTDGTNCSWVAGLTTTLANGSFLVGNGSSVATAVAPTGDVTFTNAGVFAIGATKVTNAMLAGSIAYGKLTLTGSIVDADVSASAAIAGSKLVAATTGVAGAVSTATQIFPGRKTAANSKVMVKMAQDQSIVANSVNTCLILDSEDADTNNEWAQVTVVTVNLTCTSGSATATVSSSPSVAAGQLITAANVPANTYVLSISGTTVTMSRNASASNTSSATFGEYRFTPTNVGYYQANLTMSGLPASSGKIGTASIYKNGTAGTRVAHARGVGDAANDDMALSCGCVIQMNGSTDYLIVIISNGDTSNRVVNSGSSFTRFTIAELL